MDFDKEIITHICGFSSVKVNILDCDSRDTSSILVFAPNINNSIKFSMGL